MREGQYRTRYFAKQLRRSMTDAEVILWTFLRKKKLNGFKFRRQHTIGPYVADFACFAGRLVIEVDGATHWTDEELVRDQARTEFLERDGWSVLRVTNTDVFKNLDGVWRSIESRLPPPAASPPPPPHAGEENGARTK